MAKANQFQFTQDKQATGVTVLNAVMSDFSYGKHAHEEIALGVTLEGVQEFYCNGHSFRSVPGNIILFNQGDVHTGNPGSDTALKYTMLYLQPDEFLPLLGSATAGCTAKCLMSETLFEDERLKALILGMSHLISETKISTLEYESYLYGIAKRFTQIQGTYKPNYLLSKKDTLMTKVRDYIHDNVTEDISIDTLSIVANISKYHLIRLFRRQFGLTPHRYIINYKINRVRAALKKGSSPTDVAQTFGFFDVSHMHRLFKQVYGLTPKQYQIQFMK